MRKRRRMPNDDAMQFGQREPVRVRAFRDDGVFVRRDQRGVDPIVLFPLTLIGFAIAGAAIWWLS